MVFGCVISLTMLNYQIWLLIGIGLFSFHFRTTSAALCSDDYFEAIGICFRKDVKCPDGNIFFNGECYYITNNYCSSSELWIKNKCCTLDCLKSCENGNCSYCCNNLPLNPPPLVSENPTPTPNIGCSNQSVTPYPVAPVNPIPPSSGCPNQPVTPYPVAPVNPLAQTSNCPNQPVTPYPLVPVNPIAPNVTQPCCVQITCAQTTCLQNCVNNSPQLCSQPCSKCCSANCSSCGINCGHQTFPQLCCQSGQSNCGTSPQPPICPQAPIWPQPPTTQLPPTNPPINPSFPTIPPTNTPPTITSPPPANITRCPPGTIQVGRSCQLIYCPRGSVIRDDRCVVIECPEGTVWTGYRCSMPQPITHNLTFHNTVITNFNNSKPDIILNNTNNIVVNASISLQEESPNNDCYPEDTNCEPTPLSSEPSEPSTTTKPTKCCEVMTPRICEQRHNRWHCYSRRYRRCGDFCITPIIYLRPPRIQVRPKCVIMPPLQHDCQLSGNCGKFTGGFDCSGCGMGSMENCSYYCYRYSCPHQRCGFYDQEEYCSHHPGSYGCQEEDGCYDDWCQ